MPYRTSSYSGSSYSRARRRKKIIKTLLLCFLAAFIVFGIVAMIMIFTAPPKGIENKGKVSQGYHHKGPQIGWLKTPMF